MRLLRLLPVAWGATVLTGHLLAQRPEILVADFEGTNYGVWQVTGEAFGPGPTRGTLPNQRPVDGFRGRGLVNINHILQTDRRLPASLTDATRRITVEKRYLNLPVKRGAPKRRVSFIVDGRTAREFEIELADGEPDFWTFLDLAPFQGRPATMKVDKLREDSAALKSIEQADAIKGAADLYRERLRPQFHFSSRRGWNNDPNGLVFYQGEYHLFYQHNPYGWDWGNMHWGHAVSSDLVHWVELPIALYPHRFGDWVFSGSAVVDWQNTAGFKTGNEAVLVAAYTSTGRGEAIAFSNDRGRTWTDFTGNPVVKHQGRDPRLFWHAPSQRWVMAVYDEAEGKRWIAFYTSPDLKAWQYRSRIEGFFECPDIFELPVDGDAAQKKWVLTAASSEYRVGEFDGTEFKPETPKLPGHRGSGFYAAQTYSDIPPADGRRIQIGWGQVAAPGMPFNQMMFFPCALTLRTTPTGPRLVWQPVKEIERLWAKTHRVSSQARQPGDDPLADLKGDRFDLRAEFEVGAAAEIGLRLRGAAILYHAGKQELLCQDRRVPLVPRDGWLRLRVLVDRTSLEIFADDGLIYMPMPFHADPAARPVELVALGGQAGKFFLEASELKSIWPQVQPR